MSDYFYTKKEAEKAILVGVALQSENISYNTMCEYLDELAFLAETAGAETVKIFTQNLDKPVTATFVGKGKLEEIRNYVEENDIDLVIFDDELSPTQIRNIDRELPGRKVLDRTTLILDIFAKRARTAEAKAQVELAQYQYMLPRLTGMWTHLERQKGGIGLRGPGESEIETDRRIIRDKITRLKEQLAKIDKQMTTQRKNRGKLVRVAGWIHQRGEIHADEPFKQIGSIRREQTVRYPGHHGTKNSDQKRPATSRRHGRFYPQTPPPPGRVLQIDSRRGTGSRRDPSCRGYLSPAIRGSGTGRKRNAKRAIG